VRDNTERPVTVELGTNVLAGTRCTGIRQAIERQLAMRGKKQIPDMWDGRAGARIVGILADKLMTHAPVFPELAREAGQIHENAR
jgi:UDP-N-acetylglucosamine 2-epimerase (non-hydrolysing)